MSSAISTTDASRPALAAGLYVVLYGDHLSITTEGPRQTAYKPIPPRLVATTKTKTRRQENKKNTTKNKENT